MILFHGSNVMVKEPRILDSDRYLDFGFGFYMTTNKDQAINFAQKVAQRKGEKPIVNIFSFDETKTTGLRIKEFDGPNEEWLDFVSANRNGKYEGEQFDIVIGPVADDDVYQTLQVYASGLLTKDQALQALKIKKLYNQYLFATPESLKTLKFESAEEQ